MGRDAHRPDFDQDSRLRTPLLLAARVGRHSDRALCSREAVRPIGSARSCGAPVVGNWMGSDRHRWRERDGDCLGVRGPSALSIGLGSRRHLVGIGCFGVASDSNAHHPDLLGSLPNSPTLHQDAFVGQQFRLPLTGWADQPAAGADHSPPGETVGATEEVAHRPRRAGETGLLGHFSVGDDVAGLERLEDGQDRLLESGHFQIVPKRRSPMSPRPGVM